MRRGDSYTSLENFEYVHGGNINPERPRGGGVLPLFINAMIFFGATVFPRSLAPFYIVSYQSKVGQDFLDKY